MTVYATTGHRPDKLGGYTPATNDLCFKVARRFLALSLVDKVYIGMALGWDTNIAFACMEVGIPFVACVPFEGFDSRWPSNDRVRLQQLLKAADEVVILAPELRSYSEIARALQIRNEYMIDNAEEVVALWDGKPKGGTYNAVRYAALSNKPVENLWNDFLHLKRRTRTVGGYTLTTAPKSSASSPKKTIPF